jgi:hypothetical protein
VGIDFTAGSSDAKDLLCHKEKAIEISLSMAFIYAGGDRRLP